MEYKKFMNLTRKEQMNMVKKYYKEKAFRKQLKKSGNNFFGLYLGSMGCCKIDTVNLNLPPASDLSNLGDGAYFSLMARDTISNLGVTNVYGNVGIVNTSGVTGIPLILNPAAPNGGSKLETENVVAQDAYNSFIIGFNNLGNMTGTNLSGIDLATSNILVPGVYIYNATCTLTGNLTLNGMHNPDSQWVFIIGTTFGTSAGSEVAMINDGLASNIYWIIDSASTIGANTKLLGNVLASSAITFGNAASLKGRLLANSISLDNNNIDYRNN